MRRCVQIFACALCAALCACGPEGEGPPPGIDSIQHALSTIDCSKSAATGYTNGQPFTMVVVHVDGKPVQIETANAYYVMAKDAAAAGVNIKVVSGFRTYEEQQYLYNCYKNCNCNNCNLAAKPGYSNHNSGHALDLNTAVGSVLNWLNNNAGRYGFKRTVPSENWHWEWWGGGPGGGPCDGGDEAYYGIGCLEDAGSCQSRKSYSCASGDWRSGLCPGGADVQCCTFYGERCADGAGSCQSRASYQCASGDWRSGLCPGGADVKCCIEEAQAKEYPQLAIEVAMLGEPGEEADLCQQRESGGIPDLFVDDSAVVAVDLRNGGTAAAKGTTLAIAVSAPYLEVRSWRILEPEGDAFAVHDSDGQQELARAEPGSSFALGVGTLEPEARRRVELTVVAARSSVSALGSPSGAYAKELLTAAPSDSAAPGELLAHAAVRAWVAHVDDFYEKADYAAAPNNVEGYQQQNDGDLRAALELDVFGPDDACNDEQREVDGEGGGTAMGGCALAPSSGPLAWPWLLALVGLLVARRRR